MYNIRSLPQASSLLGHSVHVCGHANVRYVPDLAGVTAKRLRDQLLQLYGVDNPYAEGLGIVDCCCHQPSYATYRKEVALPLHFCVMMC